MNLKIFLLLSPWRTFRELRDSLIREFGTFADSVYHANVIMPFYNEQIAIRAKQFWRYENQDDLKVMPLELQVKIKSEAIAETRVKFNLPEKWTPKL